MLQLRNIVAAVVLFGLPTGSKALVRPSSKFTFSLVAAVSQPMELTTQHSISRKLSMESLAP